MNNLEEAQKLSQGCDKEFVGTIETCGEEGCLHNCGDGTWFCPECRKKVKELKEKIEKTGCGKMIPTGIPPAIYSSCKHCIGLLEGKFPFDSMCEDCKKSIKICEDILK